MVDQVLHKEHAHVFIETKATANAPYHFADAGLSNVYLTGIRVFVCQVCQRAKPEIPALKELLDEIASAVVSKQSALTGEQARYLRKRLGFKATDFAAILDSSPEQLSRWENEHNGMGGATDRLIRLAYTFLSKDSRLKRIVRAVENQFDKWSTAIQGSGANERIVAQYTASRKWKAEAELVAA